MKNSEDSPRSELALIFALLCLLGAGAVTFFFIHGYTLYYGDAQCHLNIARSIIDSRTPGYGQLGSVWLPLLHVLCLPLVGNDYLWTTGLAGAIPAAVCFVIAGFCFYLAGRDLFGRRAAIALLACFALNPNVLYLASIPMTEMVFLAGLAVLVFAYVRDRVLLGALAALAMTLTRYDGWFLIPFAALWFALAAKTRRVRVFLILAIVAGLGPVYWLAHNWYETSNALDFFNGPYSAKAIQGAAPYPGLHNWPVAALYYLKAGQLCAGWPLCILGVIGLLIARGKRKRAVLLLLCLTPVFYIWSLHSGGTPIFVPQLYPHGYYNTRYGIAVVALCSFAAAAVAARLRYGAILVACLAVAPWVIHPSVDGWICWKESERNSVARRAWVAEGAAYMRTHYEAGTGILLDSGTGDVSGILCRADIPIRDSLHIGNGPAFLVATTRPELDDSTAWAIAQEGSMISRTLLSDPAHTYALTYRIAVSGAPALQIFTRTAHIE